jgi:hypothetical protein
MIDPALTHSGLRARTNGISTSTLQPDTIAQNPTPILRHGGAVWQTSDSAVVAATIGGIEETQLAVVRIVAFGLAVHVSNLKLLDVQMIWNISALVGALVGNFQEYFRIGKIWLTHALAKIDIDAPVRICAIFWSVRSNEVSRNKSYHFCGDAVRAAMSLEVPMSSSTEEDSLILGHTKSSSSPQVPKFHGHFSHQNLGAPGCG